MYRYYVVLVRIGAVSFGVGTKVQTRPRLRPMIYFVEDPVFQSFLKQSTKGGSAAGKVKVRHVPSREHSQALEDLS